MSGRVSFNKIEFDCTFSPIFDITDLLPKPARQLYKLIQPDGEFTEFLGTVPRPGRWDIEGNLDVAIENIEITERGNLYDRQGSD